MNNGYDERVKIYTGENKTLFFQLKGGSNCDVAFDLTSATEIEVIIPSSGTSLIVKKLSLSEVVITNAIEGRFSVALSSVDTSSMDIGDVIAVEIKVTIASVITITQIPSALNVIQSLAS